MVGTLLDHPVNETEQVNDRQKKNHFLKLITHIGHVRERGANEHLI